jgi:hypothetical protein
MTTSTQDPKPNPAVFVRSNPIPFESALALAPRCAIRDPVCARDAPRCASPVHARFAHGAYNRSTSPQE